jgi:hypothetical protein
MKKLSNLLVLFAALLIAGACGGGEGVDKIPDGSSRPDDAKATDSVPGQDVPLPPDDSVEPPPDDSVEPPPDDTVEPPPDDTVEPPPDDTVEPPPEDVVDVEEDLGPQLPEYLPEELEIKWVNVENMDMVSVRKEIILELADGTYMPANATEKAEFDKYFEAHLYEYDFDQDVIGDEVPLIIDWRAKKKGMHRLPSIVFTPVKPQLGPDYAGLSPTQAYLFTLHRGKGMSFERMFHTLPMWSPGYKEVEFEIPPEDCERCFPFPVKVHVFLPPEYNSPDPTLDNTSMPWGNKNQRYPVLVGLHGYNGQGMSMADAFGYKTLPRFSSQGVLEPMILVLTDGTVPQPYCGGGWPWPGAGNTCYTQFMGIGAAIPEYNQFTCYSYFMAHTMNNYLGKILRFKGMNDLGQRLDDNGMPIPYEDEADLEKLKSEGRTWNYFRRAHGITGLSGGGFGALMNAFIFADTWGAVFGIMPTTVSFFNPWAYWYGDGSIPHDQICNKANNPNYPYEPVGDGYRDLSMIDPETGLTREVTLDQREIKGGGKTCFWFSPPSVGNAIVVAMLCGLDITCQLDPGLEGFANPWLTDFDYFPFDGNIGFTTGIRDFEGPPAAFFDLDHQLDKRGIVHTFRYEDSGGVYHDWQSIYDQVVGRYEVEWQDGTVSPGNWPGTGVLYPFINAAFEGRGTRPFNHPFASEFTSGALDPDRDHYIDLIYDPIPELNYVEDNCPGVYNPKQEDSDNDGIGDLCDTD